MKKMILAMVGGIMLTATAAHAEHKLLITDVLEPKQIEAQALFEYSQVSGTLRAGDESGRWRTKATESAYSLGVGLGHGLEMTASVPYIFNERSRAEFAGEAESEKRDGFGDFAIEAKYLVYGGEEKPVSVVTGLGVKFDTAGDRFGLTGPTESPFVSASTKGTTDVSPFVAASANLGDHHIPYAIYRATIRNHQAQDTHTLTLGLEKEVNHNFTIDAKIDANFNTASDRFTANQDYVFELASYIQVAHNFYLLPSVAYLLASNTTYKPEDVRFKSADGFRGGLSLYYLY